MPPRNAMVVSLATSTFSVSFAHAAILGGSAGRARPLAGRGVQAQAHDGRALFVCCIYASRDCSRSPGAFGGCDDGRCPSAVGLELLCRVLLVLSAIQLVDNASRLHAKKSTAVFKSLCTLQEQLKGPKSPSQMTPRVAENKEKAPASDLRTPVSSLCLHNAGPDISRAYS